MQGRIWRGAGRRAEAPPLSGATAQATHVLVTHVLEEAQLAVGALGEQLRLEGPVQLLDGHFGARAAVHGRAARRDARLSGRYGPPRPPPATRPAAPPGPRSPDGAIGARAHGLQVLVHGAHLPGRLGHLLAVKARAGGRRRAHGRRGRRPRHRPRGRRAPGTGSRDPRAPLGACPRPPRRCSAPGSSLRLPEPPTPTRAGPQPGLGSARPLPCLRTNRPPGRAHVTPPAARRPLRKPEAAAAGKA